MIVFFVALLVVVQLAAFVAVNSTSSGNARAKVESELDTGQRLFGRMLEQNAERLAQTAQVLAADFGFREAVATHDMQTLVSALQNHGARIGADATLFVGLDDLVVADTLSAGRIARPFEIPRLIEEARDNGRGTALDMLQGQVYQLVAVPVRAPLPIGFVVLGFAIDNQFAGDLGKLASLDVSFFVASDTSSAWTTLATTLPAPLAGRLNATLPIGAGAAKIRRLALQGEDYQVRVVPLNADGEASSIVAVLQRSYAHALAGYDSLRNTLIVLAIGSLASSIVGCLLIALNITRPLDALVLAAQRMKQGDYHTPVSVKRADEIGSLAASLDHMRSGIADREAEILRLAFQDSLTGLPNRSRFSNELGVALSKAAKSRAPLAVLVMDLDRFKYVNDALGHDAGDHVLRVVAERLQALLPADSSVARLGGDEFAVLAPVGLDVARGIAQGISHALESPILYADQPLDVGSSIGIAMYPEHGETMQGLLRNADIAMYVAKQARAGIATYEPGHETNQQDHLSLLGELRRAVEQDELRLCYQPKLSIGTSTVTEVEALLRWEHPLRGMVPPTDFIPFAEYTGYIKMVTHWVLRHAIEQCGRWIREGMPLAVSINISARDLMNRELPEQIAVLLAEHRVPGRLICLELTESGFMEDPAHAQQVLERLAQLGLRLSIDDYGTGYSSLSYIMKLPVNELKIDRSFISSMVGNTDLSTIVRSTIDLGHNLGLKVVAEGVETAAGLELLRQLGCDQAQGFYLSRPLFADDLALWLRSSGFAPTAGTKGAGAGTGADSAAAVA
ncbi:MAG TPA: EAL domain-containing protein [Steroidobacteraceae bacterium]|nr:EAL domain-containing protein [Steroidobacteraceae bacterium]